MKQDIPIFIGHDFSTVEATLACTGSIIDNTKSARPSINYLNHRELRREGLFSRQWDVDETGQYWDKQDGRPFSTEFSFSRFCTADMASRLGYSGWVMFCDSDFIFLQDLTKLFKYAKTFPDKALLTVQFDWQPSEEMKMDGRIQSPYDRKLWSSLMMINLDHPGNDKLTTQLINTASGSDLHRFCWLSDEDIGSLPSEWNWIEGISPAKQIPAGVHYSHGLPIHKGYESCKYSDKWGWYLGRQLSRLGGRLRLPKGILE
jgi:hypothetical protein